MQKAKTALDNVLHWLLASSANPDEASLTVKGALLGSVPAIMYVVGVAHLNLGQDQVTAIFDGVANAFQALLTVIATSMTLYGAVRKALNTLFASSASTPAQG